PGDAGGGGVTRLVRPPAGGAGGQHEVDAVALEQRGGLAVVAVPHVHQRRDVRVIGGEPVDVQVVVLIGRGDHVPGAVVVDERGDVAGHVAERPEAAQVGVVPVHGGGDRHRGAGLAVVAAVLLVHPHHELPGARVVDDLGPFDVGHLQLGGAGLGEHVVAELPVAQVGRPVGG